MVACMHVLLHVCYILRRMDFPLVHILIIVHFLPARVPQVSLDLLRSSYSVLRGSHLGTCLQSRKSPFSNNGL